MLLFELRYPSSLKGFGACFKNLLRLLYACKLGIFVSVFVKILLLIVDFFAMSLPPKVVSKPAAVAVSGPGSGPSPSSQLRATLTSVSLPPGAPTAPQPGAVPPPQYPLTWVRWTCLVILCISPKVMSATHAVVLYLLVIDNVGLMRG